MRRWAWACRAIVVGVLVSAAAGCALPVKVPYETPVVVTGKVLRGSNPEGTAFLLRLDRPVSAVSVIGMKPLESHDSVENGQRELHLVELNFGSGHALSRYVNTRVVIRGRLSRAATINHVRRLLLVVDDVAKDVKPLSP